MSKLTKKDLDNWSYEFQNWLKRFGSFPVELVRSKDNGEGYEVDRRHIFKLENGMYAFVSESGCSCYSSGDADIIIFDTLKEANREFEKINDWDNPLTWKGGERE